MIVGAVCIALCIAGIYAAWLWTRNGDWDRN